MRRSVNEVLVEERHTRARVVLDAPRRPPESASSGDATPTRVIRIAALLLGAGIGTLGGAALGDRPMGVAFGVAAGLGLAALLAYAGSTAPPPVRLAAGAPIADRQDLAPVYQAGPFSRR